MMLASPPPSVPAASAVPSPGASSQGRVRLGTCEAAAQGIATIAIDPAVPIVASAPQSFIVALRSVSSAGYGWKLRPNPAAAGLVYLDRVVTINDVALQNVGRPPGTGRGVMVGGASTQYFLFRVLQSPGSATLTFDETGPVGGPPSETRTFTATLDPTRVVC